MNRRKLQRRTEHATKLRIRWMLQRAGEQLALESAGRVSEHFEPITFAGRFLGSYINKPAVRLFEAPITFRGGSRVSENFTYEAEPR